MVGIVIPALDPPGSLEEVVRALAADSRIARIVVVDDGSGSDAQARFRAVSGVPRVELLRHDRNRGKGAALKTAFAHIAAHDPDITTVVTADADGQHRPDDILRVAEASLASPGKVVLGVRRVGREAPMRSRVGNTLTRWLFSVLVGEQVSDTQTGLRAIPRALLPAVSQVSGTGFEFELNMLVYCRQAAVPIAEVPIASVYAEGNPTSHFRPVRDSVRIYAVLVRFGAVSLGSAIVDNLAFGVALASGAMPSAALALARVVSVAINYPLVKFWVFPQSVRDVPTLGPYLLLVALNVVAARLLAGVLQEMTGLSVVGAKVAIELLFFLPNFLLQRDLVFRAGSAPGAATDWDAYYDATPFPAQLTRRYTARQLAGALETAAAKAGPLRSVAELGGAASSFVDGICRVVRPDRYLVVDTNAAGLSKLRSWTPPPGAPTRLELIREDVRRLNVSEPVDTAFSIGLIEHFPPAGTREVLAAHFAVVRPGGAVVVSYPTPTWLYVATRRLLEALHLWKFPDERPVRFDEVSAAAAGHGTVVHRQVMWPLLLTQELVVFVKR